MSVSSPVAHHNPSPAAERVAKISLRVRDLNTSAAFYVRVLGCRDAEHSSSTRVRRLIMHARRAPCNDTLELVAGRPVGATSALDHIGIEVLDAGAVDLAYRRATEAGARALEPRDTKHGRRCVVFDPDGYKIEVFCVSESSQHDQSYT